MVGDQGGESGVIVVIGKSKGFKSFFITNCEGPLEKVK